MLLICSLTATVLVQSQCKENVLKEDNKLVRKDRSVIAGAAIAGTVLNGLSGFLSGINGPNNVKDVSS